MAVRSGYPESEAPLAAKKLLLLGTAVLLGTAGKLTVVNLSQRRSNNDGHGTTIARADSGRNIAGRISRPRTRLTYFLASHIPAILRQWQSAAALAILKGRLLSRL